MGAIDWNAVSAVQGAPQPVSQPKGAIDWNAVQAHVNAPAAPASPLHSAIAAQIATDPISQGAQAGPSMLGELGASLGNLFAGGVRGAGSIGSTLISASQKLHQATTPDATLKLENYPVDQAPGLTSLVTGQQPVTLDAQRRADMDSALTTLGADTDSIPFKVGKLSAEVAGTSGVGGVLANALRAGSAAPAVTALADAVGSGGFNIGGGTGSTLGNLAARGLGGAINGGASAALVDPANAGRGAVVGAALPLGVQAVWKALQLGGSAIGGLVNHGLGATTGAGSDAISTAYQAGKDGSTSFLDNLRGNVPMADVVDQARAGIANLRADRASAYKAGMSGISADKTVLDFQPVTDAINKVNSTGFYKGQQINGSAADTINSITDKVNQWKALDPKEFHTAEGFDALKQSIGDIRDSTPFGTPARVAADRAYNAIRGQIVQQAPAYANTMQGYADASDQISEITKALSLGEKASADTSLRKLQSLMRNNAQTNYGNRLSLAQALQEQGNTDLMPSLAGQALSSWTPRGMVGALEKGGGALGALAHPAAIPGMVAAAPFMSPRIMGEAAYGAGRLAGSLPNSQSMGAALLQGAGPQATLAANPDAQALIRALMNQGVLATTSGQ